MSAALTGGPTKGFGVFAGDPSLFEASVTGLALPPWTADAMITFTAGVDASLRDSPAAICGALAGGLARDLGVFVGDPSLSEVSVKGLALPPWTADAMITFTAGVDVGLRDCLTAIRGWAITAMSVLDMEASMSPALPDGLAGGFGVSAGDALVSEVLVSPDGLGRTSPHT